MAPFTQVWNEAGSFSHFPGASCGGFELIRENVISWYLQTSSWIINLCCGINYLVSETKWSIFSFKAFTEFTFCISERGPPYCSYPSGSLHAGTCALGFGGPGPAPFLWLGCSLPAPCPLPFLPSLGCSLSPEWLSRGGFAQVLCDCAVQ